MKVSKDQRTKPQTIVYYDHMKGGVVVLDFISAVASTRIKSEWWSITPWVIRWRLCAPIVRPSTMKWVRQRARVSNSFQHSSSLGSWGKLWLALDSWKIRNFRRAADKYQSKNASSAKTPRSAACSSSICSAHSPPSSSLTWQVNRTLPNLTRRNLWSQICSG